MMNYGLGAILAIGVASSMYAAQIQLYNQLLIEVHQYGNVMEAAVDQANKLSPGFKQLEQGVVAVYQDN